MCFGRTPLSSGSLYINTENCLKENFIVLMHGMNGFKIYIFVFIFWHHISKHLAGFELWCWRRMEKIICTDHARNEGVVQ